MRVIFGIFLLMVLSTLTEGCNKPETPVLSNHQKEILSLYATEYLETDYQHLYYKSEEKEPLLQILELPLQPEDFKLNFLALPPGSSQSNIDSLFTNGELAHWTEQLRAYQQLEWNKNPLSDKVNLISEEEIPAYLQRTDIPPPGQDPVFIHYITPPFVYKSQSALMYSRKWSSGANVQTRFHYFVKDEDGWKLEYEGSLSVGY